MKLRNMLLVSFFAAMALVFNAAESMLPMPLPGMKLGAANIFSLAALVLMGTKEAFAVTLLRVALSWIFSANVFALACSLSGGIAATAIMALLYNRYRNDFSLPWISVAGAWGFNIFQTAAAAFIVGDIRIALYLLPLLAAGTAAGWAVGVLAGIVVSRVKSADRS